MEHLCPSSCYLQHDIFFYVTVLAFIALILLCNICVFTLVLIQIRRMKVRKPSENSHVSLRDLRTAVSLTILLGLTWIIALFCFGPQRVILIYPFTISNSLQGKVCLAKRLDFHRQLFI